MSQTLPATAMLGPGKTGLSIGYKVLNLNRTTYSSFTTTNVAESPAGSGTYNVSGGIVAPDAGGYVIFGVSGTDYAEAPIDPAPPTVAAIQSGLSTLTTSDIDARLAAYDAATGADVSALAAILAVTNPDPDEPGEITVQRGTTIDREIDVAIIPASWTSARLTVKRYIGQADSEAVLQILVSSTPSASDGLQILNSSATVTKTDAELTVTYATGKATFHLEDALTAALAVTNLPLWWDLKFYYGSSDSVATTPQRWNVTGIVTEAV